MMTMNSFWEYWESPGSDPYWVILLVFLFLCHVVFLLYRGSVLWGKKTVAHESRERGVSVILTCANKGELLRRNLEAFLNQDYPDYEVIVVDECSEDYTQEVLSDLQKRYAHLKTTRIFPGTKFRCTKKIAINIGILAARNDILLFTEIECQPESKYWVREMQAAFDDRTAVVIGYANYPMGKKVLSIGRYFRFLWFWKNLLLVRCGMYVSGNGYNMGYRKKYYLEKHGFTGNTQEYVGFDSQMVKELSVKGNVRVVKQKDARMCIADESWKAWHEDVSYHYADKRRWPWKARLWNDAGFIIEGALYGLAFYFILFTILWKYVVILTFLTFLMDLFVINACLKHLGQRKLFITSLTVNAFGFIYKWYYGMYSIFSSKRWR